MNKPHWHALTKYLKSAGEITTGLTIPYLYGAYQRLDYKINSIEDLLIAILDSEAADLPVIEKCDVIKHDVLKLESRIYVRKYRPKESKIASANGRNELVISYNTRLGDDLKRVSNSLIALYQRPIDDGTFSWSNKERRWKVFEETDYKKIDAVK